MNQCLIIVQRLLVVIYVILSVFVIKIGSHKHVVGILFHHGNRKTEDGFEESIRPRTISCGSQSEFGSTYSLVILLIQCSRFSSTCAGSNDRIGTYRIVLPTLSLWGYRSNKVIFYVFLFLNRLYL